MASLRVTTNSGNVLASVNLPDTALPVIREVLGLGATATNQEVAAAFLAYIVERLKPEFKAAERTQAEDAAKVTANQTIAAATEQAETDFEAAWP